MWTHGHFYWNELMSTDVAKARSFYADTLGWTFNDMPMPDGTYHVIMDGEQPVGGMYEMSGPQFEGVPEHWFAYIAVDDVDARVKAAVEKGAKVHREPFDVEGVGRICILQQPTGAMIGWMTPANQDAS